MKARWLLSVGAVAVTLALAGTDVVQADQARPRNSEAAGRSSGGSSSRGGGGGSSVAPRGGGSSGGGSSARSEPSRPRSAAPRRDSGAETSVGTARRRAPEYSRPSTGRAVVGHAVSRGNVPGGGGSTIIVRPRSYYPWGLGWGGGYFYDPFWWDAGYWDPFWGPSWGGYLGHGWGPGYWGGRGSYGGYGGYRDYEREDRGALRLKMKPREAEIFVEGDFVGQVDDYDGAFQRLRLPPGRHRIQVRAEGYEPLEFSVLIVRDQTVTYRGDLRER